MLYEQGEVAELGIQAEEAGGAGGALGEAVAVAAAAGITTLAGHPRSAQTRTGALLTAGSAKGVTLAGWGKNGGERGGERGMKERG